MIAVVAGARSGWRLVSRTGAGADVLALRPDAADGTPDSAWRESLRRLRDGEGELRVASTGDGHYQWVLAGRNDETIAQSPPVYRDAGSCCDAFTTARRIARTALAH